MKKKASAKHIKKNKSKKKGGLSPEIKKLIKLGVGATALGLIVKSQSYCDTECPQGHCPEAGAPSSGGQTARAGSSCCEVGCTSGYCASGWTPCNGVGWDCSPCYNI